MRKPKNDFDISTPPFQMMEVESEVTVAVSTATGTQLLTESENDTLFYNTEKGTAAASKQPPTVGMVMEVTTAVNGTAEEPATSSNATTTNQAGDSRDLRRM